MPAWLTLVSARARSVPWLVLYRSATWLFTKGREYWDNLSAAERRELGDLVRKSKGRRTNLTTREYDRLKDLVRRGYNPAR